MEAEEISEILEFTKKYSLLLCDKLDFFSFLD